MSRIRPKNWASYQHYKDRDPTWIKLHKRLLDDYEFQCLPLASRALAPMLWLIASEDKEGWIDADPKKLAFRLRCSIDELVGAIKALIDAAFFEFEIDASTPLAEPERVDSPENKRQVTSLEQDQTEKIARSADADEIEPAFEAYNLVAEELSWPVAQALTLKRRAAFKARLSEVGGLSGWRAAMAKARASPFLRGESGRDKAHEKWVPDLDFFLQQSAFTKLMEGKYDDRQGAASVRSAHDTFLAAAASI